MLTSPDRPLVAILGGAKVSDKLEVIQNFLGRVDRLIIGGAMAYTFLKARGVPVGRSLVEDDKLDVARDIEAKAKARGLQFGLPVDHVVAAKLEAGAPSETLDVGDPKIGDRMGLDIGPKTIASVCGHDQGREDRRLERPDGRVRDSRFREGHERDRATPWPTSRARPSSAAAIRLPRSTRPASPIASRTSPPAAARRWNFWAGVNCRESKR